MFGRVSAWLSVSPWLYGWAALLMGAIAYLDYLTGVELSFSVFYLLSVGAVSWWGTGAAGVGFSILGAAAWLLADTAARDSGQPGILLWNASVRLAFFVAISLAISRIRGLLERERELSNTDYLTGAANARGFYGFVEKESERSRRSGRPMTVAYIDLDNFKEVNDRLGHPAGDDVLRRIAATLGNSIRRIDMLARLGGDEFALLLPETSEAEARTVLSRARENVLATTRSDPFPVTATVGAVTFDRPPSSVDDVVSRADHAMYKAKRQGKNRVVVESG